MANPKDIDWLRKGHEQWNDRRNEKPSWIPDLSDVDVSGKPDLCGYNLSKCNLKDSTLSSVDLSGADLSGADLSGADLSGADLSGADLTNCKLWKAQFPLVNDQSLTSKNVELKECEWISNIEDLLSYVKKLNKYYAVGKTSNSPMMFFRGERRKYCCLRPSVMRPKSKEQYPLRERESELLMELIRRRPEDFTDESTAFGQLMIAQHYRLPTRLLDVSQNPLVSLFHACEKDNKHDESDARLHILVMPRQMVKPYTSHTVSVISNFTKLKRGEQNLLLTKTKEYTKGQFDCPPSSSQTPLRTSEYCSAMARLVQYVRLEHSSFEERIDPRDFFKVFVVQPQQSIDRIRAQSGAFLLSAFHEQFDEADVGKINCDVPIYHQYTFKIHYKLKKQIRKQLSTLNITEETMYPGLEKAAKAVKHQYGG